MCGRFVRFSSWADLRRTMTLLSPSEAPELSASYNVAPMAPAPDLLPNEIEKTALGSKNRESYNVFSGEEL